MSNMLQLMGLAYLLLSEFEQVFCPTRFRSCDRNRTGREVSVVNWVRQNELGSVETGLGPIKRPPLSD